jgi:hypothetical protein
MELVGIGIDFVNRIQKAQKLKEMIDKWQMTNETAQQKKWSLNWKAIHRMEENLCQLYIWQGLDNQHLQGAQKTELSKIVYSPSYVDFRSRVNIAMLLDLGHMLTGEHIREEWG